MKISMIVAVYNIEKYLDRCLQSLIKTGQNVTEIICVDDGSTDNSYSIICKYSKKDPRIVCVHKENGGLSSARNRGMQIATGDFLIFIDGDDYIEPDKLDIVLNQYKQQLDSEIRSTIWCGYINDDWSGEHEVKPLFPTKLYGQNEIREQILRSILGISFRKLYAWFAGAGLQTNQEFPSVWRLIYSKKILDEYKIVFNEYVITGEDILFNWEYFAYAESVQIVDAKYYHYVWRRGSLTQNTAEHFYVSKTKLVQCRDALNKRLTGTIGDFSEEYQGTLILTKIQMALALSDCSLRNLFHRYKMFSSYARLRPIVDAYKKLQLKKAPLKYKLPLYMARNQWNLVLFFGCYVLAKLKIQIYPEV